MKVYVRPTRARTLPLKAAAMQSFSAGVNGKERRRLLIGTYQLEGEGSSDDKSERCGSICVVDPISLDIERHIRLPCGVFRLAKVPAAIWPCRTTENGNSAAVVAALTDGRLALLEFDDLFDSQNSLIGNAPSLSYSSVLSSGMLLDCSANFDGRLVCSDNLGNLSILRLALDGFHSADLQWRAHPSEYGGMDGCEVWSCCWTADDCQCCASGAEDALLKVWDVRCPTNKRHQAQLTNRSHSAGVTFLASSASIQRSFGNEQSAGGDCSSSNLLLSGSYDDHLRSFDLRRFDHPLSELKLNGGVWCVERLGNDLLLAACMYGGWSIVRGFPSPLELVHSHSANGQQLLYAATIASAFVTNGATSADAGANSTVASCTFNDAMLRLESVFIGDDAIFDQISIAMFFTRIVAGVPKYRTSKPRILLRRYNRPFFNYSLRPLVQCSGCGGSHEPWVLCMDCYRVLRDTTETLKRQMLAYNPYVGQRQRPMQPWTGDGEEEAAAN